MSKSGNACSYWSTGTQRPNSDLWVKAGYLWGANRGARVQAPQEHGGWPDPRPGAGWTCSLPILSEDIKPHKCDVDQNSVDIHYTILTAFFAFLCLVFNSNMQFHLCPTNVASILCYMGLVCMGGGGGGDSMECAQDFKDGASWTWSLTIVTCYQECMQFSDLRNPWCCKCYLWWRVGMCGRTAQCHHAPSCWRELFRIIAFTQLP